MHFLCLALVLLSNLLMVAQTKQIADLEQLGGEVDCIGFSTDGRFFFTGSLESYVTVWTTANWTMVKEITPAPPPSAAPNEHQDEFRELAACAVEPKQPSVLIASGGDSLAVYSLLDGHELQVRHVDVNYRALSVSADGEEVAVGTGKQISTYSFSDWRKRSELDVHGMVGTLRYAPRGHLLAVAIERTGVQLWNTRTKSLVRAFSRSGNSAQMNFSPDGRMLAVAVWGGGQQTGVKVWEVSSGKEVAWLAAPTPNAHQNDVWAVAFSPDGRYIVSGDTNGNVTLWNTATWKTCAHLGTTGLYELEVSLDGRWLASGGGHRDAYIWDFRQLAENCR